MRTKSPACPLNVGVEEEPVVGEALERQERKEPWAEWGFPRPRETLDQRIPYLHKGTHPHPLLPGKKRDRVCCSIFRKINSI